LDESQDKRTDGAGNKISKIWNIKRLFSQRQWWESPAHVRPIRHQTPKYSAPVYQAKQSRASCAKPLTASPCRKHLRACEEKEIPFAVKVSINKKAVWNKE
jgi:hypothetical protein